MVKANSKQQNTLDCAQSLQPPVLAPGLVDLGSGLCIQLGLLYPLTNFLPLFTSWSSSGSCLWLLMLNAITWGSCNLTSWPHRVLTLTMVSLFSLSLLLGWGRFQYFVYGCCWVTCLGAKHEVATIFPLPLLEKFNVIGRKYSQYHHPNERSV